MKMLHKLRDRLCDEFDEKAQDIMKTGRMTEDDLRILHDLSDTVKNLCKIEMLEGKGEYSRAWDANGGYSRGYGPGYSYEAYDGTESSRNPGTYSQRRDSMGRYSRAAQDMASGIEDMLRQASGKEREILRRAMEELRNA